MPNFWTKLNRPIFALAPMEEVTDFSFREMFAKYGKPDVMFTEFVNVDGLAHPEGRKKLLIDLKFSEAQRPIVAQIWGRDPEKFYQAAQLLAELGFDGIDINMGCPQDKEITQKTCAALIREPKLAQEIIQATKKGAGGLPVSVKTRLGYSKPEEITEWLKYLLECQPAAVTIHGRTKQEKSKVPARWEYIAKAVEIRDEYFKSKNSVIASASEAISSVGKIASSSRHGGTPRNDNVTLIIGNGDVRSREEGLARIKETGADGVMIARGAFGNPWLFNKYIEFTNETNQRITTNISPQEKLRVMLEHARLFDQTFKNIKSFAIMRKHFKAYASGFPGSHELRAKLMETKNLEETEAVVAEYLKI